MDSTLTRKATDVLLNIEQQVSEILGYVKNQDMLIKALMNRLAVLERSGQPIHSAMPSPITESTSKQLGNSSQQLPGLKPGVVIKGDLNNKHIIKPINQQQLESPNIDFPSYDSNSDIKESTIEVDNIPIGKRRTSRYVDDQNITVQQKVLYPDGKCVSSARIEIFTKLPNSDNLVLVQNKKTNATGKWTGQLPPGNYLIKVFKKGTGKTPNIETQQTVIVPNSDDTVQLKPIQT